MFKARGHFGTSVSLFSSRVLSPTAIAISRQGPLSKPFADLNICRVPAISVRLYIS